MDVQFDLKVVEVGHRNDVTFRAPVADETRSDEFAAFDVALQNGARERRPDDSVVELRLREGERTFGLFYLRAHGVYVFPSRANADQRMGLFIRRESGDLRVVTG